MNDEEILANNIEILTVGNINKQNLNICMIYGISGNCGKNCPRFKDKTCEEYLTTLENEYLSDEKEIERLSRTVTNYDELLMQKNNIIAMVKEYLIEIRRSPSYELDEKVDNLEEILDKEIK